MLECGDRLQAGDDRDRNACGTAFLDEIVVNLVVEEHLCDHIVRTGIHFPLQVGDVGLKVRCLEMFFRVGADADAEIPVVPSALV